MALDVKCQQRWSRTENMNTFLLGIYDGDGDDPVGARGNVVNTRRVRVRDQTQDLQGSNWATPCVKYFDVVPRGSFGCGVPKNDKSILSFCPSFQLDAGNRANLLSLGTQGTREDEGQP